MTQLLRQLRTALCPEHSDDLELSEDTNYLIINLDRYRLHVHANGMVFLSIKADRDSMVEIPSADGFVWDKVFWFQTRREKGDESWFPEYGHSEDFED